MKAVVAALLIGCGLPAGSAQSDEPDLETLLSEVSYLSGQGVKRLGLSLLAAAEPDLSQQPDAWVVWHRKKIELLAAKEHWQLIMRAYEALPLNVPASHRDWLFVEVIKAYLNMGGGEQARDLLLGLIWDGAHDARRLALWRRLVAQSYLIEGRHDDAAAALLRYQQDYPDAKLEPHWLALQARLLVAEDRASEAAILTVAQDAPPARSTYVLARLASLAAPAPELVDEAFSWLADPALDLAFKQSLFSALFDQSRNMPDWPQRISVLERLLDANHIEVAQITAVVDALWFALAEYGRKLANDAQLLVGNFAPWFDLAQRLDETGGRHGQALYAWLATHAAGQDINARAHGLLVRSLAQQGEHELLRSLYLSSTRFSDPRGLPLALMYQLVDMALAGNGLALAVRLMSGLDAPQGVDMIEWQLRRARLQILAGAVQEGGEVLRRIVDAETLTDAQVSNLLLAVRDLGHQGHYQDAHSILAALVRKLPDSRRQTELYFWMGESQRARQHYSEAARLYLDSARLAVAVNDAGWRDLARRRAAEMLEQAGLTDDAVALYRGLLGQADSASRALYRDHIRRLVHRND